MEDNFNGQDVDDYLEAFGFFDDEPQTASNSKEELLDKIKNVDWDSIKSEENKIGGRFDFSV